MLTKDPALVVYILTVVALTIHMILLDAYAGVVRVRTKTVVNSEDAGRVAKSVSVVDSNPPEVARVMRAHRNLFANAVPFLILGLAWVMTGASLAWALGLFGAFLAARIIHTFAYVGAKQPWRTAAFIVGQLALVGVVAQVVRNALA